MKCYDKSKSGDSQDETHSRTHRSAEDEGDARGSEAGVKAKGKSYVYEYRPDIMSSL